MLDFLNTLDLPSKTAKDQGNASKLIQSRTSLTAMKVNDHSRQTPSQTNSLPSQNTPNGKAVNGPTQQASNNNAVNTLNSSNITSSVKTAPPTLISQRPPVQNQLQPTSATQFIYNTPSIPQSVRKTSVKHTGSVAPFAAPSIIPEYIPNPNDKNFAPVDMKGDFQEVKTENEAKEAWSWGDVWSKAATVTTNSLNSAKSIAQSVVGDDNMKRIIETGGEEYSKISKYF